MKSFTLALAAGASIALAGCGGGAADTAADENLEEQAADTADELGELAPNVMDSDQANVLVNESLELQNAADAAANAEGNAE